MKKSELKQIIRGILQEWVRGEMEDIDAVIHQLIRYRWSAKDEQKFVMNLDSETRYNENELTKIFTAYLKLPSSSKQKMFSSEDPYDNYPEPKSGGFDTRKWLNKLGIR